MQKKQYEECCENTEQLIQQTEKILKLIEHSENVHELQSSILSRLILFYRDILFNEKFLKGSEASIHRIKAFIFQFYQFIQFNNSTGSKSINFFEIFDFLINKDPRYWDSQGFHRLLTSSVESQTLAIFKKELSKSLPVEMLLLAVNLYLRGVKAITGEPIEQIFKALSESISVLIGNMENVSPVKIEQNFQYGSILAKGIFDLLNIIIPYLSQNEQELDISVVFLHISILHGIMTLLSEYHQLISGRSLQYVTAILHRISQIFHHYFSNEKRFSVAALFSKVGVSYNSLCASFLLCYDSFLASVSHCCSASNSIDQGLLDAITSLTVVFVTNCLSGLEPLSFDTLSPHLKVLSRTIRLHTFFSLGKELSNHSKEDDKVNISTESYSGAFSIDSQTPHQDKHHKLMVYFISLAVRALSGLSEGTDTIDSFEQELIIIIQSDYLLWKFVCSYVSRELNQKISLYSRDQKVSSLRGWKIFFVLIYKSFWKNQLTFSFSKAYEDMCIRLLKVEFNMMVGKTIDPNEFFESSLIESQVLLASVTSSDEQNQKKLSSMFALLHRWFFVKGSLNYLHHKLSLVDGFDGNKLEKMREQLLNSEDCKMICSLYEQWEKILQIIERELRFPENEQQFHCFIAMMLNSSELMKYSHFLTLIGAHRLQLQLYQLLSQQKHFYQQNPYYNADIIYCFRVQLCIYHYWNNYSSEFYLPEKQLFNTKSNLNFLENMKNLHSIPSTERSLKSLSVSQFSYNNNIFLSLEDYFFTSHQFLTSTIPTSSPDVSDELKNRRIQRRINVQSHCNYLLSECRHFKSLDSVHSNQSTALMSQINHLRLQFRLMAINSWICLFFARILFLQFGEVSESLHLCRQSLAFCSQSKSESIYIPWSHVKFETLLLISEIYDFVGKPTRCQEYLAESLLIANHFPLLDQIYQLHAFRLFLRLNSKRLEDILLKLLNDGQPSYLYNAEIQIVNREKSLDQTDQNYLILTQEVIHSLFMLFPSIHQKLVEQLQDKRGMQGSKETSLPVISYDRLLDFLLKLSFEPTSKSFNILRYRFTYRFWGLQSEQLDEISINKQDLKTLDEMASLFQYTPNIASSQDNKLIYSLLQAINKNAKPVDFASFIRFFPNLHSHQKYNLQILKQLRKEACARSCEPALALTSQSFDTFLYGASSLFLSSELSPLSLSSLQQGNQNNLLSSYGEMINNAIQYQDPSVKAQIALKLRSLNSLLKDDFNSRLFFISVDSFNKRILFGGACELSYRTSILSGKSYDLFMSLIKKWREVLEENHHSLHCYFPGNSGRLTNEQKRQWWLTREAIDSKMERILLEMNQILRPKFQECLHESSLFSPDQSELSKMHRSQLSNYEDQENCPWNENVVEEVHTFHPEVDLDDLSQLESEFRKSVGISKAKSDQISISSNMKKQTEEVVKKYEALKLAELKTKLKERGLAVSGKKSDLIQRLLDDDKRQDSNSSEANLLYLRSPNKKLLNDAGRFVANQTNSPRPLMKLTSSKSNERIRNSLKGKPNITSLQRKFRPNSKTVSIASINSLSFQSEETSPSFSSVSLSSVTSGTEQEEYAPNEHFFLLIDELIQEFPFECLPEIKKVSSSRVLSLPHLFQLIDNFDAEAETTCASLLPKRKVLSHQLDKRKSWFVVDSENNLPDTQKVMVDYLTTHLQHKNWKIIVGRVPTEEEIR